MTLITNPRHEVLIFPAKHAVGRDGGTELTWGEPVKVKGNLQPVASDNLNRTSSVRDEYYGETVSTTAIFNMAPGTLDRVSADLPADEREGFPIDALVVFYPGAFLRQPHGTKAPANIRPFVYTSTSREVIFRMGIRTQHDRMILSRGNDIQRSFLEGKI